MSDGSSPPQEEADAGATALEASAPHDPAETNPTSTLSSRDGTTVHAAPPPAPDSPEHSGADAEERLNADLVKLEVARLEATRIEEAKVAAAAAVALQTESAARRDDTASPSEPRRTSAAPPISKVALTLACVGALGAVATGFFVARALHHDDEASLETRVTRIEAKLGIADAGALSVATPIASARTATGAAPLTSGSAGSVATAGTDRRTSAECAVAKVAAYDAWQDALARAKVVSAGAEAQCAEMWSERKKQACYYAASTNSRSAQVARDSVMKGGVPARDAVKNVKDDPKNDAVARARTASGAAFAACQDENEL